MNPISTPAIETSHQSRKPFVAFDGEGYTKPTGKHVYNLLGSSSGNYIHDADGLRTKTCFEFLMAERAANPNAVFVSFYFSYDVNMILTNLHRDSIEHLSKHGFCILRDKGDSTGLFYKVEYMPKKFLRLSRGYKHGKKYKSMLSMTIYDVWGFFQSSFVKALREFEIGDPDTLDFIESMKGQRSAFELDELETIIEYNRLECELLTQLMDTVRNNFEKIGLYLKSWHGAGAAAGELLRVKGIKTNIVRPTDTQLNEYVMSAYFGGRVQSLQIGVMPTVYNYDIVSAYPSVMRELPSLRGLEFDYISEYQPENRLAVYHVEWNIPTDNRVTPFPFRKPDGTIEFPYSGSGIYWSYEVAAAMEHFPGCVRVIDGWSLTVDDPGSRPFDFIDEYFEWRKELKRNNDKAQVCIKLCLNSLYGKTAQGTGYRGQIPAYQSYIYAGLVTSGTRAQMFRAAMQKPDSVVAFATDGLCTTEPIDLDIGTNLGQWESALYDEGLFIKPGFYHLRQGTKVTFRVRGFPQSAVDFERLRETWLQDGINGKVTVPVRQFIGMKSVSVNRQWQSWLDTAKVVSFWPSRGTPVLLQDDPPIYLLEPPYNVEGRSAPYRKHDPDPVFLPDDEYSLGID